VVARRDVEARLRALLTTRLLELGVRAPVVEVERLAALPRPGSGKLKLVTGLDARVNLGV
jgi:hypothetical protein